MYWGGGLIDYHNCLTVYLFFFNSLLYLAVPKLAKNLVLQDVGFWEDRVMGESRWECRSWQKPHISFLPCLTNTDHIVP